MSDTLIWLSLIFIGLITIGTGIYTTFGLMLFFGAPWVPTRRRVAREMLEFAGLKEGETIIDLGSGDGSILIIALKEFGASKAIGYELNPFLNRIARLRAKLAGVSDRLELRTVNVYKEPIEETDVLSMYLLHNMLDKLRPKLVLELSDHTRVISRGFEFSNVKPIERKQGAKSLFFRYRKENLDI